MALEKLVQLLPDRAEPAFDLAGMKAALGKQADALKYLKTALEVNALNRKTNPTAPDLIAMLRDDPRYSLMRTQPDFQKLVSPR
jgi:hypothetical protein